MGEDAGDYELASAANGFEAGLQLGSFQPDLLILDLAVPDSLEVCRSVKANPASRHTRILVLAELQRCFLKKSPLYATRPSGDA